MLQRVCVMKQLWRPPPRHLLGPRRRPGPQRRRRPHGGGCFIKVVHHGGIAPSSSSSSSSSSNQAADREGGWPDAFPVRATQCHHRAVSSSALAAPTITTRSHDDDDVAVATAVDFATQVTIAGDESHVALVHLYPGQVLRAESGAMLFMSQNVTMQTHLHSTSSALRRLLTGQNVFLSDYRYNDEGTGDENRYGVVGLGTDFPSKILRLDLTDMAEHSLICQRGALLAASSVTVDIQTEVTKNLSTGFFGGQGFILQRLTGQGQVLVKGGGVIVEKRLAPGETLRVSAGSLVCFEPSLEYSIAMMPGVRNVMFGGQGLFVTTLRGGSNGGGGGGGRVWLQSMPPDRMIAEIARRMPAGPGIGIMPFGGGGGGHGGDAAEEAGNEQDAANVENGNDDNMATMSDQAVEADRANTVTSSAAMSEGGAAATTTTTNDSLFGDAAPPPSSSSASTTNSSSESFSASAAAAAPDAEEASFASSSSETTFRDADFDEGGFSSQDDASDFASHDQFGEPSSSGITDGELFDDSSSGGGGGAADAAGDGMGDDAGSGVGGFLSSLWDFFNNDEE